MGGERKGREGSECEVGGLRRHSPLYRVVKEFPNAREVESP